MLKTVTEEELPGQEKGWYVVRSQVPEGQTEEKLIILSGPFDFLWRANKEKQAWEKIEEDPFKDMPVVLGPPNFRKSRKS